MVTLLRRLSVALLAVTILASQALAVEPDEMLADPVLEARAREISKNVRCLVCQNENIDESNADLARDLRLLVRERLVAGDSNQEVFDYLVARYGDWVLLTPPWKPSTYALWLAPFAMILLGGTAVVLILAGVNRRRRHPLAQLSAADEAEIERIMNKTTTEN